MCSLTCIGIFLVLISLYNLANFYQTKNIFTNAKIGAIVAIIGTIILSYTFKVTTTPLIMDTAAQTRIFIGLLCLTILIWTVIVAAFFVRRSLNELANHSGTNKFATSGTILLGGAVFTTIGLGAAVLMSTIMRTHPYTFIAEALIIALFGVVAIGVAFLILVIAFGEMKKLKSSIPFTTENSLPNSV
jgi:uncharacterized membrane protein